MYRARSYKASLLVVGLSVLTPAFLPSSVAAQRLPIKGQVEQPSAADLALLSAILYLKGYEQVESIALDPRFRDYAIRRSSDPAGKHSPRRQKYLAAVANLELRPIDELRVCSGREKSTCSLSNRDMVLAASEPVIGGTRAQIRFAVWKAQPDYRIQPIHTKDITVELERIESGWRVVEVKLDRIS